MNWLGRATFGVTFASCLLLLAAGSANAATTLGQTSGAQGCGGAGYSEAQIATGAAPAYTVPAGGGIITSWSTLAGSDTNDSVQLRVFRATSTANQYLVVADGAAEPLTPSVVNTFSTHIAVRAGDVIGINVLAGTSPNCDINTSNGADTMLEFSPDTAAPGDTESSTTTYGSFRADMSARLETDSDGDGFADETEDRCPGAAGTVQGCPKADLSLAKGASASTAYVGQNVTYTVTARNSGPDAAPGAVVSDALPSGAILVSATPTSGSCNGSSTVSCNVGTLASGAAATVTLVVKMMGAGSKTDAATVGSAALDTAAHSASGAGDPNPANNSASATTTVLGAAVVSGATQQNKTWAETAKARLPQFLFSARRRRPVGTTFKFRLDRAANIRLDFTQPGQGRKVNLKCVARTKRNKRKPKCAVTRGSLSFAGRAGLNTVRFEGWLSKHKKLKPGKYTVVITATTPGVGATFQKLTFRIVK